MNVNFSEIDDLDNKPQFDVNYWETSTTNTQTQKKKKMI